jgi:hypothetical protein
MISNLKINFSIISLWSNPLELYIEDLYLIVGPNMGYVSHDESYLHIRDGNSQGGDFENPNESYDSTNAFNVFDHELQIKKKLN